MALKLLTLNTHSWLEKAPYQCLFDIAEEIAKSQYDLIALQEVNQLIAAQSMNKGRVPRFYSCQQSIPLKEGNFALLLVNKLADLGLDYYWSWLPVHIGYDRYDEGVAILSRYPINQVDVVQLSSNTAYDNFKTRRALGVNVVINEKPVWLYSLHFSWWEKQPDEYAFQYEWSQLQQHLSAKQDTNELCILAGDFNNAAHIENEGYSLVQQKWHDAYILAKEKQGEFTVIKAIDGWELNQQKLRIDYIFFSHLVDVERYCVVFDDKHSPVVSDHFGVAAVLN